MPLATTIPTALTNNGSKPVYVITVSSGNAATARFETVGGKLFETANRAVAEDQLGWTLTSGNFATIRELAPGATYVLGE